MKAKRQNTWHSSTLITDGLTRLVFPGADGSPGLWVRGGLEGCLLDASTLHPCADCAGVKKDWLG